MRGSAPVAQTAEAAAAYTSAMRDLIAEDSPKANAASLPQLQLLSASEVASAWAVASATSNANAVDLEYEHALAVPPPVTLVSQDADVSTVACTAHSCHESPATWNAVLDQVCDDRASR